MAADAQQEGANIGAHEKEGEIWSECRVGASATDREASCKVRPQQEFTGGMSGYPVGLQVLDPTGAKCAHRCNGHASPEDWSLPINDLVLQDYVN